MTMPLMFMTGLLVTSLATLVVVAAVRRPLEHVLSDLCGTPSRARFWGVFSAISLVIVPLTFALNCDAFNSYTPPVLQIAAQVKWGLIGLLVTVLIMGWTLSRWIARHVPKA